MCKASGISSVLLCTVSVGVTMKELKLTNKIKKIGTFKDSGYFDLDSNKRALVDKMAEEICLSVRFLSLVSKKIYSSSKKELVNDMVKGEINTS